MGSLEDDAMAELPEEMKEIQDLFAEIDHSTDESRGRPGPMSWLVKNPLIPAGMVVTCYFLMRGYKATTAGDGAAMNYAFKGRIVAQFATIGVICFTAGLAWMASSKQQMDAQLVKVVNVVPVVPLEVPPE